MESERVDEILRFIRSEGSATVKDISDRFGLNEATVRRDLRQLQLRNLISREYGKATFVEPDSESGAVSPDYESARGTDRLIVDEALLGIRPGQMVILPGSPLALLIASALAKMSHLSVVTNSLNIFEALRRNKDLHLISTGGIYDQLGNSLNGSIAEGMLQNLRADLLFIEPSGISLREGFTHDNLAQIPTLNAMIRSARQVVVVARAPAFDKQAGGIVAPIRVVHKIITDRKFEEKDEALLSDAGIEVARVR
jgi:DeoR/GlpR family transcriptional regulator of sugar metabolism